MVRTPPGTGSKEDYNPNDLTEVIILDTLID